MSLEKMPLFGKYSIFGARLSRQFRLFPGVTNSTIRTVEPGLVAFLPRAVFPAEPPFERPP
jgi:hypothetical protein